MALRASSLACVALLATACSDPLERQSLVEGLRVLAISAEPPEVAAGEGVTLSALWHDEGAAPPRFEWWRCVAPADGTIDACASEPTELGGGEGVDAIRLVPEESGTILVRLTACAAPNGDHCADEVEAVKRVLVGDTDRPNHNPTIETLRLSWADGAGDVATVELVAGPGSIEETANGAEEELFVSWFATEGAFEDDRSFGPDPLRFETTWAATEDATDVRFWAVLRDGHGGVAWAEADSTQIGGR